jgi:hypothetical protein
VPVPPFIGTTSIGKNTRFTRPDACRADHDPVITSAAAELVAAAPPLPRATPSVSNVATSVSAFDASQVSDDCRASESGRTSPLARFPARFESLVIPTEVGYRKKLMRREWLWAAAGALLASGACGGTKTAEDDSDDHRSGRAGVSGSGGRSGGRGGTDSDGGESAADGGSAAGKAGAPARGGSDSDGGESGEDGGSAGKAGARAGGGSAGGGRGGNAGGGDGGASASGATGGQGGSSGSAGGNAGDGGLAGAFAGAGNGGSGGVAGSGNNAGFSGSTGMGGSGGEPSVSCDASFAISSDGFVRAPTASGGCWFGYAFSGGDVGSTWIPTSFGACGVGCMLRLSGTVNAANEENSYAGVVSLGFSVRQAAGSSSRRTVVPTGDTLELDWVYTSPSGSARVQLSAGSSPSTRWCAMLTAPPNSIPYTSFNTKCWDPGQGTSYTKQPIDTVQLVVVGDEFPRTFDVRIYSIKDG